MTVLLRGERGGLCERRCHEAEPETPCRCICDGAMHGIGEARAVDALASGLLDGSLTSETEAALRRAIGRSEHSRRAVAAAKQRIAWERQVAARKAAQG